MSFRLIICILIFFAVPSFGQNDVFHRQVTVPSGKYKGQQYDTSDRRSVVILDSAPEELQLGRPEGHYLVANFYHNRQFYFAHIPKDGVEEVLFQTEPFGGVFAHSLLRFNFASQHPIRLIAPVPAQGFKYEKLPQPILLHEMIVTPEAMAPHGIPPFQAVAGFLGHVGVVIRVASITGRGVSRFLEGNNPSRMYPIQFDHRERNTALEHSLRLSQEVGMQRMYNTIYCNCNILSMQVLKSSRFWHDGTRSAVRNMMNWFIFIADKFMIASKIYPPLALLGLYWRKYLGDGDVRNLKDDPRFLELAEDYRRNHPEICAPHL